MRATAKALCALLLAIALTIAVPVGLAEGASEQGEWLTFLLMCNEGNQNDRGDVGNTTMVFSLNPELGIIRQAGVRWDIFIDDPSYDVQQLLDQPFRDGGVERALELFNENFEQDIGRYLSINYLNLAYLIDEFGGVYIDISRAERNAVNGLLSSKVASLENELEDLGLDSAAYTQLVESYYLNNYGAKTHLNGLQAISYGWLQYDSVYQCCLRQVDVISQLFFQVSSFIEGLAFVYTDETADTLASADKNLRPINLDDITADDEAFLYSLVSPIFTRSAHNLEHDEIITWLISILRAVHTAQQAETSAFNIIEFQMIPDDGTEPYEQEIQNARGMIIDFDANIAILNQFLYTTEGSGAGALEARIP